MRGHKIRNTAPCERIDRARVNSTEDVCDPRPSSPWFPRFVKRITKTKKKRCIRKSIRTRDSEIRVVKLNAQKLVFFQLVSRILFKRRSYFQTRLLKSDIYIKEWTVERGQDRFARGGGQQQQCYYKLIRGIVPLREYSFNVHNTTSVGGGGWRRISGYTERSSPPPISKVAR